MPRWAAKRVAERGEQLTHPWPGSFVGEVDGDRLIDHELLDAGHGGEVVTHRDPLAVCLFAGVTVSAPDQERLKPSPGISTSLLPSGGT